MSEFTGSGFEQERPNTHVDRQRVIEVAEMSDDQLTEMIEEHIINSRDEATSPRARRVSEEILNYAMFERLWREGYFDE